MDGIEQVRARNRQRYYGKIDRLKATGQYEAFKQHKCTEGKRPYRSMSAERRNEVRRKNLILQKTWRDKMIQEGKYGGVPTTLERAAAGAIGGEKTSHGSERMEGASEGSLCEACRVRATQKVELVGGTIEPPLSSAVVAAGLGGVRAGGGGHCANDSCQCIAANGPVLVNENNPLNLCVQNNVSFLLVC